MTWRAHYLANDFIMVIYLSLFKGITLFCLSMLPSSAYFPKPLVEPVSLAVLQANPYSSVCYVSCGFLYAWPRLTESKLLSGFQMQTLKGHCSLQHWKRRKILHRNLWKPSSRKNFWKTKPVCMLWDAKGFMEFSGALNGAWLLVATPPLKQPCPLYVCHLALEEPNVPQRLSHCGQQI